MSVNAKYEAERSKDSKLGYVYLRQDCKVKYNRRLSGKFRLYLSDRNTITETAGILSHKKYSLN